LLPSRICKDVWVDSSVEGFLTAMDISCHSFVRMAKLAEPLMTEGGVLVTMSYYGAEKVVPNYSLMGPVKAALEAAVRYLAYELGPKGIRVHAVSPGPLKTRAASGLAHFDELLAEAEFRAPERDLVDILDIGAATANGRLCCASRPDRPVLQAVAWGRSPRSLQPQPASKGPP
jgi:enoyl-[acyl-carrier protein] reductase I